MILTVRDRMRLEGVHHDLVKVVERSAALTELDFMIVEGLRTAERQKQLFAKRATRTMSSRHLTGHAVDVAPILDGEVRWDWPLFYKLADVFKQSAADLQVALEWGGDWKTFKDGPHFQLSWKRYPA